MVLLESLAACSATDPAGAPAPLSEPTLSPPTSLPVSPTLALITSPVPTPVESPQPTPAVIPTSEPLAGTFVISAGDGSIWVVDAASGSATNVVPTTPGQFASAPIFSLDGQKIIFVMGVVEDGQGHDSIRTRNPDGSDEQILLRLDDPGISFNFPVLSPDGAWLYLTANIPLPQGGRRNDIQRLSLSDHSIETIVRDARQQSLSADGAYMTYIRFDPGDFTASLWISDADGKNEHQLMASDIFDIVYAPRFAPDGNSIVFAASGPNKKPLPGLVSTRTCEPVLLCLFARPASASTDGLPWDLWSVTPDGTKFTRLTDMAADSPYPAWSRDSKFISFLTQRGMFVYNTLSRQVSQLNHIGAHGSLDWWQSRE